MSDLGFDSEELDSIFEDEETETIFDFEKELKKVGIENVTVKKGDVYDLDKNKYIRKEELIDELFTIIDQVNINELGMRMKLEEEIKRFNRLQRLATKGIPKYNINEDEINTREYAKYVLKEGTALEKRELLGHLRSRLLLEDKKISLVQ